VFFVLKAFESVKVHELRRDRAERRDTHPADASTKATQFTAKSD
jgi:hypothetical protein